MNTDEIWRYIDDQRAGLADLLESLTPSSGSPPSLCEGGVCAMSPRISRIHRWPRRVVEALKSGFRFDR